MTSAVVAFYKDNDYVGNVYYNSDGYPAHLGKLIYNFLRKKHMTYNTVEELYGKYILDPKTEATEIRNYESDIKNIKCYLIYSLKYDSETKNIVSISVQEFGNITFNGNLAEFAAFIEQERKIMFG